MAVDQEVTRVARVAAEGEDRLASARCGSLTVGGDSRSPLPKSTTPCLPKWRETATIPNGRRLGVVVESLEVSNRAGETGLEVCEHLYLVERLQGEGRR